VWVVRDDETLALRPVSVARFDADTVSIAQGLQPGEVVVAQGVHAVSEGQHVRPVAVNEQPAGGVRPQPAAGAGRQPTAGGRP
jgi:hypothetical protein